MDFFEYKETTDVNVKPLIKEVFQDCATLDTLFISNAVLEKYLRRLYSDLRKQFPEEFPDKELNLEIQMLPINLVTISKQIQGVITSSDTVLTDRARIETDKILSRIPGSDKFTEMEKKNLFDKVKGIITPSRENTLSSLIKLFSGRSFIHSLNIKFINYLRGLTFDGMPYKVRQFKLDTQNEDMVSEFRENYYRENDFTPIINLNVSYLPPKSSDLINIISAFIENITPQIRKTIEFYVQMSQDVIQRALELFLDSDLLASFDNEIEKISQGYKLQNSTKGGDKISGIQYLCVEFIKSYPRDEDILLINQMGLTASFFFMVVLKMKQTESFLEKSKMKSFMDIFGMMGHVCRSINEVFHSKDNNSITFPTEISKIIDGQEPISSYIRRIRLSTTYDDVSINFIKNVCECSITRNIEDIELPQGYYCDSRDLKATIMRILPSSISASHRQTLENFFTLLGQLVIARRTKEKNFIDHTEEIIDAEFGESKIIRRYKLPNFQIEEFSIEDNYLKWITKFVKDQILDILGKTVVSSELLLSFDKIKDFMFLGHIEWTKSYYINLIIDLIKVNIPENDDPIVVFENIKNFLRTQNIRNIDEFKQISLRDIFWADTFYRNVNDELVISLYDKIITLISIENKAPIIDTKELFWMIEFPGIDLLFREKIKDKISIILALEKRDFSPKVSDFTFDAKDLGTQMDFNITNSEILFDGKIKPIRDIYYHPGTKERNIQNGVLLEKFFLQCFEDFIENKSSFFLLVAVDQNDEIILTVHFSSLREIHKCTKFRTVFLPTSESKIILAGSFSDSYQISPRCYIHWMKSLDQKERLAGSGNSNTLKLYEHSKALDLHFPFFNGFFESRTTALISDFQMNRIRRSQNGFVPPPRPQRPIGPIDTDTNFPQLGYGKSADGSEMAWSGLFSVGTGNKNVTMNTQLIDTKKLPLSQDARNRHPSEKMRSGESAYVYRSGRKDNSEYKGKPFISDGVRRHGVQVNHDKKRTHIPGQNSIATKDAQRRGRAVPHPTSINKGASALSEARDSIKRGFTPGQVSVGSIQRRSVSSNSRNITASPNVKDSNLLVPSSPNERWGDSLVLSGPNSPHPSISSLHVSSPIVLKASSAIESSIVEAAALAAAATIDDSEDFGWD